MSEPVRFLLNGQRIDVGGLSPQTTLLEYLREVRRLTGTKEGCAEGDCGACTVVLAEPAGDRLAWKPVNACIRLLPSVDGKAVFTVESLAGDDGIPHPLQRALVASHASQCGFCTPGFAMSLFGLYKNAHRPDRHAIEEALSGNLCRCTGYRPIVEAAQRMYDLPPAPGWRGPGVAGDGSRIAGSEEEQLASLLGSLARTGTFEYAHAGRRWMAPRDARAVAQARALHPQAQLVAGATDLALSVTKEQRELPDLIYVGDAADLRAIDESPTRLQIGAAVSLAEAFAAMTREWPELDEAWQRFASVPIRNGGTLAGNVANGSPIGDAMPVLLALDARVALQSIDGEREVALTAFYPGYRRTALAPGEFIASLRIPRRPPALLLRAWKVAKRHDQDIAGVFACLALELAGERIRAARIGCGGVAATPLRATSTEDFLAGSPWTRDTAEAAAELLASEFAPIDDARASAAYRRRVLGNLLRRFWIETSRSADTGAPTRVDALAAH